MLTEIKALFILILCFPSLSYCQETSQYGQFINNFNRCNKLKVNGEVFRKNSIVYFEAHKIDGDIILSRLIGEHDREVYHIISNAFDCMEKSNIDSGVYKCLYIIEGDDEGYRKSSQLKEERADKILNFTSKYNLPDQEEIIMTIYRHPSTIR